MQGAVLSVKQTNKGFSSRRTEEYLKFVHHGDLKIQSIRCNNAGVPGRVSDRVTLEEAVKRFISYLVPCLLC